MKMIIQNKHYFTTFLLTSESKCNFRATNPALNCDLLCLKQVADSLNIPPELQQLGHRAILTLEVGSLQATFRLTWRPSLVWCCKGRLVKVSLMIDTVLVNSRALRPPPRFKHHHIIGRNVVRLALCT